MVLVKVELRNLHGKVDAAAEYFASKSKDGVKTRGSSLQLEVASVKDVKLLVHKFLHDKGLDGYRVVVIHPGLVEVLPPEHESSHGGHHGEGSPPTAPVTMPYYFPGGGSLPSSVKKSKKTRKK